MAFLPLEIFAHKLRGFIDSLGAEIVKCADDSAVLAFRSRGWFGIRSSKGVFLQLDTYARSATSGYRARRCQCLVHWKALAWSGPGPSRHPANPLPQRVF